MNRRFRIAVSMLGGVCAFSPGIASGDEDSPATSWSSGFEYSTGTYGGTEDIEALYLPVTGRLAFDRFSVSLTIPYLSVRGPLSTSLTDPGGEALPGSGETVTNSGLGDVVAGVTLYDVAYSPDLGLALDLSGKIKFGTADEAKGLGTGENDFTFRADLYKYFDQFTLLSSAGYRFRGEPAGLDLDDVFVGSFGGIVFPNEQSMLSLIYDYRESSLADADAISELTASLSWQLGNTWIVDFYAFTGFSDSSSDWGAGLRIGLDWQTWSNTAFAR